MVETFLQWAITQGPSIAIMTTLCVVGFKYFAGELAKKDAVNQEKDKLNQGNLDRYILLVEKNMEIMSGLSQSIHAIPSKLNEMHEDIRIIKGK